MLGFSPCPDCPWPVTCRSVNVCSGASESRQRLYMDNCKTSKSVKLELATEGRPKFAVFVNNGNGSDTLHGEYQISRFGDLMAIAEHAFEVNNENAITLRVLRFKS